LFAAQEIEVRIQKSLRRHDETLALETMFLGSVQPSRMRRAGKYILATQFAPTPNLPTTSTC